LHPPCICGHRDGEGEQAIIFHEKAIAREGENENPIPVSTHLRDFEGTPIFLKAFVGVIVAALI